MLVPVWYAKFRAVGDTVSVGAPEIVRVTGRFVNDPDAPGVSWIFPLYVPEPSPVVLNDTTRLFETLVLLTTLADSQGDPAVTVAVKLWEKSLVTLTFWTGGFVPLVVVTLMVEGFATSEP